jgi:predicted nucleic acid-binding protein
VKTIDASVLIAAWLPDDGNHTTSRAWLVRHVLSSRASLLPSLALTEIAGGLRRRTGDRVSARRAVRHLLALPGVRIVEPNRRLMWRATLLAATIGLRGADAVYVAVAHQFGAPLITWDTDQLTRAALVVTTHTPLTDIA